MEITVDKSFPGGNIAVEKISAAELLLNPELRDTEGCWFYWSCRVRGAAGKHLRIRVELPLQRNYPTLSCLGPAVCSSDGHWHWNPFGLTGPTSFEYQFAADENEVFFSNTIPYTEKNWQNFLQGLSLQDQELCRSRKGRRIEMLEFCRGSARPQLLITARHHCCESMASFVLEGMALELLQNWPDFALLMLPFMDKDGCEDGDQGKNRRPHDHNRDYGPGGSIYPSVQALREYVPKWLQPGARLFAFDAHCPMLAGEQYPHWTENSVPELRLRQHHYAQCLQAVQAAGFGFHAATGTPYGIAHNAENRPTACSWFATLPGIEVPFTVETPYALCNAQCRIFDYNSKAHHSAPAPGVPPQGHTVLPESARNWGRDLIRAVQYYAENPCR